MKKLKAKRYLSEYANLLKSQTYFFALENDIVLAKSNLIVDCGATKHVITDKLKLNNFNQNFE